MLNIENEFNNKIIFKSGLALLRAEDAIDFINRCNQLKYKILGIDSFKIIDDKRIQPLIEFSIDYSSTTNMVLRENVWDDACNFIYSVKDKGFLFEIIYE
ncbi:MAG: hypothetical protein HC877_07275 [Thioploca sp.]|nr:hypothetical protein [Thioploca sp.]